VFHFNPGTITVMLIVLFCLLALTGNTELVIRKNLNSSGIKSRIVFQITTMWFQKKGSCRFCFFRITKRLNFCTAVQLLPYWFLLERVAHVVLICAYLGTIWTQIVLALLLVLFGSIKSYLFIVNNLRPFTFTFV
jgi:hypothetical protein